MPAPVSLAALAAAFVALALWKTFPLVRHFATHLGPDPGDPFLNLWILAWGVHALWTDPLRLFDANIFHPVERALAFSDHLLGVLPVFAPAYLLTDSHVAAYNTVFVLSFVLSALSAFALAYHWTRAWWPSIVGGALFGFAQFRFGHLGHLQLLNMFWAPIALIFLDRFLRGGRWRDGLACTAFYSLQVLASAYLAYLTTVAVAVCVASSLVVDPQTRRRALVPKAVVCAAVAAAVLVPTHLAYLEVHRAWGATRALADVVANSPDVLNYFSAPTTVNRLYTAVFRPLAHLPTGEKWLFPGLVLPALVALGCTGTIAGMPRDRVRRIRVLFGLLIVVAVMLSLGPRLIVNGQRTKLYLPYAALYHLVPGWSGMRAPGRFALLAVLAAVPLATLGAWRCVAAVKRWTGSARFAPALTTAALVALVMLELGAQPLPLEPVPAGPATPAVDAWLAAHRPGPVLHVPMTDAESVRYQVASTAHWQPLVNGVSGFFPPLYAEVRAALRELPARDAVAYASALGVKMLVVHTGDLPADDRRRWSTENVARSGLTSVAAFGDDRLYRTPALTAGATLAADLVMRESVPPDTPVSVELRWRPDASRPWAHPAPQGRSRLTVEWTPSAGGSSTVRRLTVQLPPVVVTGGSLALPLVTPSATGRYRVGIDSGAAGVTSAPQTVDVSGRRGVTSSEGPSVLGAAYATAAPRPLRAAAGAALSVPVDATNTGRGIWLAVAERRGTVKLNWRWWQHDRKVWRPGRLALRHDVFPGESYAFQLDLETPATPGDYVLELGLVSEGVAHFADVASPALKLAVKVRSE